MFERCTTCDKLLNTKGNLIKYGAIAATGGLGIAVGGWTLFGAVPSFIGFGSNGIVANSAAASWQSTIGCVPPESLFAALQSLGATGKASLLTSSLGSVPSATGAYYWLRNTASKFTWCQCE